MFQLSVLVADDNEPIRAMMATALRPHFCVLKPVAHGRQLVESVLAQEPDVIVSDVFMPVLGGIEAMQVLRSLGCTTPFVMVSADPDVAADCLASGAAAFVSKIDLDRDLVPAVLAVCGTRNNLSAAPFGSARERASRIRPRR